VHGIDDRAGARIAQGATVTAVAWSGTADVLAYIDRGVLYTVRPDGRERRRIPLRGVVSHPVWAPGGDRLVTAVHQPGGAAPSARLWVLSPDGVLLREILWDLRGHGVAALGWYPDSLYLFVGLAAPDGETVAEWWRVRIAYPDFRRLPGPPARVVESLLSPNGEWIAYVEAVPGGERASIVRRDGTGHRALSPVTRRISGLAWAPHSHKLAYGVLTREVQAEVYVAAVATGNRVQVASYQPEFPDPAAGIALSWSPDGSRLAYGTNTGSTLGPVWLARFTTR
jgi:Tol biopolymer transport system component